MCENQALEWLDAVRARLDAATPGPWDAARPDFRFPAHVITGGPSNTDLVATNVPECDANLIASAPDRLDRMERALRVVLELAEGWRYKGEFGWDDGSHAYGPGPEGEALDWASAELVSKIQEALG